MDDGIEQNLTESFPGEHEYFHPLDAFIGYQRNLVRIHGEQPLRIEISILVYFILLFNVILTYNIW